MISTSTLSATARKRIEHTNGWSFERGVCLVVRPDDLNACSRERTTAQRPEMLHAEIVRDVADGKRPFGFVVPTDALVVAREAAHVVAEPQRLIERQRIIELAVHVLVIARCLHTERVRQRSSRQRRI